jgi:hypothetical protein
MRATIARPSARLLSLKQAEAEFGLPYAQLLDLIKRGELSAVQPPNVRRIYLKFLHRPETDQISSLPPLDFYSSCDCRWAGTSRDDPRET